MFNTLKTLKINNETLSYRELGSGEDVLVLIHGNMSSSRHFDLLAEALKDRYRLILPDMRGFGGSTYEQAIDDLAEFAQDISAMLKALNIETYSVLGWSTGGGVAMVLAGTEPEKVRHLYLLESVGTTGYPMFKKDEQGQAILTELLTEKADIALDPVQVAPVLTALANKDKAFYKALWDFAIYTAGNQPCEEHYNVYLEDMLTQRNLVDVDYALVHFNISTKPSLVRAGSGLVQKIQCPVTVFQGAQDIVVPMSMAEEICEDLPQAKLVILENAAHNPMIDQLKTLVEHIL